MSTCPKCGAHISSERAGGSSNQEREIVIRVPERDFHLMRKTFREMSNKLGMHGYGELANALKPYASPFNDDFEFERIRYFDDAAMAMVNFGIVNGYSGTVRISKATKNFTADHGERKIVHVDFAFPEGKTRSIQLADYATAEAADWYRDHFADISARLAPVDRETKPGGPA